MATGNYNLNGANYGPAIQPPPVKTYYSQGRRGADVGCGICGCFYSCLLCCGSCLVNIICTILLCVAICLGFVALILYFILQPKVVNIHVTDANLTRFELDPRSHNLHYNLSLNFAIRNPNQRLGIHYDQLEARGYYGDKRFAAVNMTSFFQGHKNTTVVGTELKGQKLVLLGAGGRKDLKEDRNSGIYRIDVKLRFKIRFKFGVLNSWAIKPKIKCHLKVPLSTSNSAAGFQFLPTKCHVDL
ncbi:PREDICTED: NDR1/HIN1-Like protein 3-like [Camelina sativa]|uniref:NDR1/HIN1-Like protein 3-like n=1 Tax=Camelina sativa TaxID=90675 RepID=A0ABM0Z2S3_CAMSA|nr:PREDICTED: NDR1/HIN1-Like protein 3-like [Camelina sativa]